MLQAIEQIDTLFFEFMNKALVNSLFDLSMPFITQFKHWIIPLFLFALWMLYKKKIKGLELIIVASVSVLIADYLSSHVLKPYFERARPCEVLEQVRVLLWCNSSRSFPSSHAANSMAIATVVLSYFKTYRVLIALTVLVGLICFSRIYIGVHYPFDIAGGLLVGYISAKPILFIRRKFFPF